MKLCRNSYWRVLLRSMCSDHICWRKFNSIIFSVVVVLVCLTVFHQKTSNLNKEEDNWSENELDYYGNGRHLSELTDGTGEDEEEVDMVYTWVNGSDPTFIRDFERLMESHGKSKPDILALNRYEDWGTLRYSLRSVEKFAPWIRHVYLVTNGQIPYWLAKDNPRISIVTHNDIFTNKSDLPAFTSPAIECHIHRIKGLSKRFLYMNDDILLTSKLQFSDFFSERYGFMLRFMGERLEHCNKICPSNNVNNGICEATCTSASCEFDGDDCKHLKKIPEYSGPDKDFMYDSWGGSLRHTHFLFNKAFGPQDRYIPEHAAHLFDKDILANLIESFPEEFNRTSSAKIRHHLTIQPEFAYYNYVKALEQLRTEGIKTTTIWTVQNAEKIDFKMDNRRSVERKKLYKWCKRELLLKRPKFLVFSDHFTFVLSDEMKAEIHRSLDNFLNGLFPKPSTFEQT